MTKKVNKSNPYQMSQGQHLGMDPNTYRDYIGKLADEYLNNKDSTIKGLCEREREKGYFITPTKLMNDMQRMGFPLRKKVKGNKKGTKLIRMYLPVEHVEFMHEVNDMLDKGGQYGMGTRRDLMCFLLDVVIGNPTRSALLFLDETKPVVFLWNSRRRQYATFGSNLSEFEEGVINELIEQVDEAGSLQPVKYFAANRNLKMIGGTYGAQ